MLRDARVRLFLTSATLLFVELLLIRWVPGNVVYVGFSALLSESAPASVHVARPDIAETNTRSSGG